MGVGSAVSGTEDKDLSPSPEISDINATSPRRVCFKWDHVTLRAKKVSQDPPLHIKRKHSATTLINNFQMLDSDVHELCKSTISPFVSDGQINCVTRPIIPRKMRYRTECEAMSK